VIVHSSCFTLAACLNFTSFRIQYLRILFVAGDNVCIIVLRPSEVGSSAQFKCPVRISVGTLGYID
jgi:hypothetical protein